MREQKRGGGIGFVVVVVLLLLGIVIPLAAAPIGAALVWLIFTIPIYAILAVLPLLCIIGLGALLAGRLIRSGPIPYIAGAVATFAALLIVPYQANPKIEAKARALVAADKLAQPAPVRTGVLALVHPVRGGHRATQSLCGDLCRTLLLDGKARTVLIALDDDIASGFKPDLKAVAYSIESRAACPDTGAPAYDMDGETTQTAIGQSSKERVELAATQGRCLVARPAVAGDAEVAAIYGDIAVRRGQKARWFSDDQFTTRRISLWQRDGTGFREAYRHTFVAYDTYWPVLMPTILLEGTTSHAGFARSRQFARQGERFAQPEPARLLLGPPEKVNAKGGLNQTPRADVIADTRKSLARALDAATPPSPAERAVAESYLDGMAWGRRELTPEDADLAARLLTDDRFAVTNAAAGIIKGNKHLSATRTSAVARSMFGRLRAMDIEQAPMKLDGARFEEAMAIGGVIEHLPDADILRHRADMVWLAGEKTLRAPAYQALSRLDLVGGGQMFLYLIDDSRYIGAADKDGPSDYRYRQHPYLAGIKGLCALGADAVAFKPALVARIGQGTVARDDTSFNTLVAMGASLAEVEDLFKGSSRFVRVRYEGGGLSGPKRKVTTDLPIRPAYERAKRRKDCAY